MENILDLLCFCCSYSSARAGKKRFYTSKIQYIEILILFIKKYTKSFTYEWEIMDLGKRVVIELQVVHLHLNMVATLGPPLKSERAI